MSMIILHILFLVAVTLFTQLRKKNANKRISPDYMGVYKLRKSRLYLYAGAVLMTIAIIYLLTAIPADKYDQDWIILTTVMLFILGGGYFLVMNYLRTYVHFDKFGVEVKQMLKDPVFMPWSQIKQANYNAKNGDLVLSDHRLKKARIDKKLVGFNFFINQLEQYTNLKKRNKKFPAR